MSEANLIPVERIEQRIFHIRGQKVMLDYHLADLYEVETRALNQALKRNLDRFPGDFMFQLSVEEMKAVMRSQNVIASTEDSSQIAMSSSKSASKSMARNPPMRSQLVIASKRNIRFRPYAFTEQGVAMLSSILHSDRAVQVNIEIMRAFVRLRQLLISHADLGRKLEALESKYDEQFKVVFDAIRELMAEPRPKRRREIGFHAVAAKRR